MKRLLTIILLLAAAMQAQAIVAPRTPYKVRQPDGSYVTLINHGDEFHHWTTKVDGTPVEFGADGFCKVTGRPVPSFQGLARRAEAKRLQAAAAQSSISMGEKHFLVLLIEFSDQKFTLSKPAEAFTNLLNEENYSANGGTGSVRDFYSFNSRNQFIPTFDVYGPVTLSKSYAYYGKDVNDSDDKPDEALYEACQLLDDQIDFSRYDHDHDGYVDNVFFYYAGYNQAEGASSDTIWPHAWSLYRYNGTFDGVRVWSYACASEYRGTSGKRMCGIGTFTHEFGHVLGLPDFYDTNYEKEGDAVALGMFSTMDSGCYNNEGRTPPLFNAVERNILGWMDEPEQIVIGGPYTLEGIAENKAYCNPTSNPGEIFIYEVRDGRGWDSYIPAGLVVYHLDKSHNPVGNSTAAERWQYMYSINEVADHPCFYVVPSGGTLWPPEYAVYPGVLGVTSFEPVAWSGETLIYSLSDIASDSGTATFTLKNSPNRTLRGVVADYQGMPIEGARIFVRHGNSTGSSPDFGVTAGIGGSFNMSLSTENGNGFFSVMAYAAGFSPATMEVDLRYTPSDWCEFRLEPAGADSPNALTILGFNTIANPGNLQAGEEFPLQIISMPDNVPLSVKWYWDGSPVQGNSVVLTKGRHTVKAVQSFNDRTEDLFLEITVE